MKSVQLVQDLHYSINVNDYLRIKCWRELVVLCYYNEQMQNLPNTHPGAVEETTSE